MYLKVKAFGFGASVAVATALHGCGGATSDGASGNDASSTSAFVTPETRWSALSVPVCWESTATSFSTEKGWVRAAIESQYHAKTRLRFTGWNACSRGTPGIHIGVYDEVGRSNPHTKGLGRELNGIVNGMELNFAFDNWSSVCKGKRRQCIESIAVHEFGHAAGVAHEQNRSDTPDTCTSGSQGTSTGAVRVGSWDLNSAMNYCNPTYNNNGKLSQGDLAGISYLYGSTNPVPCRVGYTAVSRNLCQSKTNPAQNEAYFELDWWVVAGDLGDGRLDLERNGGRARGVSTQFLTQTVDGGRPIYPPLADDSIINCRDGRRAVEGFFCQRTGSDQLEAHYASTWWLVDPVSRLSPSQVNLQHPSTTLKLRGISVSTLTAVTN